MSGHSHSANIAVKKAKADAIKGKIFTKIGREIAVAAKSNPDPSTNSKLADCIAKAKAANMPNDNIKRCIAKAAGELGNAVYENLTYEGYGPNGTALIIETLTDNKNRTVDYVRTALKRNGGELGNAGCVSYMFDRKGIISVVRTPDLDEDTMMEYVLESGANDMVTEDDCFVVDTDVASFSEARKYFEDKGLSFYEASVEMVPQSKMTLSAEANEKFMKLLNALEDLDDVQEVYHNVDLPEEYEEE